MSQQWIIRIRRSRFDLSQTPRIFLGLDACIESKGVRRAMFVDRSVIAGLPLFAGSQPAVLDEVLQQARSSR
jgi:hypothetical protein